MWIKLEKGADKTQSALRKWKDGCLKEKPEECKELCDRLHICDMGDMDGVQIFMELVNML